MPTVTQRLRHIIGDEFGAAVVEQNLEKAIRQAKESARPPETQFFDSLSMFMGTDWVRKSSQPLSFTDLRGMATNPIVGSIIQTRLAQTASFMNPQESKFEHGFVIEAKDRDDQKDRKGKTELTAWLMGAGIPGYGELSLEQLARKMIRDSLVLDQATAEIVPRRNGAPAYLVAIDAATIRLLLAKLNHATPPGSDELLYVQLINEKIVTSYTSEQMIFGVRNPRTDLKAAGYGFSELEMLIRTVTTILNTERFNSGQLQQGGTHKGIFVLRGQADATQFAAFKRDFREAMRNAGQYWRPPVLQVSKDSEVDWVKLDSSNRDMEYSSLFDFLVKQACGVYQIDPSEINWTIGATGVRTTFESTQDKRLAFSQRKGLQPLLSFFADLLNQCVISRIDPRFAIKFVGLLANRQQDGEIREREVKNFKTINELREELGLDPIDGGDIVLNEQYLQSIGVGMDRESQQMDLRKLRSTIARQTGKEFDLDKTNDSTNRSDSKRG